MNGYGSAVIRLGAVVTSLGVVTGAVYTIDTRYVHADEFKQQVFQIKDSISDLHRARLEDEIFKLELIPVGKRTQVEKALLDRYRGQIEKIDAKRGRERP